MFHDTQIASLKGKQHIFPSIKVCDVVLLVTGGILKIAKIFDEAFLPSKNLPNPLEIIKNLRSSSKSVDIFTFTQRLPDVEPRFPYHFEWENAAVASTGSYRLWFETQVDRSVRKHIRKGNREGIITKIATFDDRLVERICSIYNEMEIRQGRKFWHYGKSFDEVKRDNGTYLDRSVFITAYFGDELVGFIKFVIDGEVATIMQILSKAAHFSKRPNNALLSKAVEVCESQQVKYLIYGEYIYGKKNESTLVNFKKKNGFKKIEFPRYYVPLTAKGHFAVRLGLYKDFKNLIPGCVRATLFNLRLKYYAWRTINSNAIKREK